MLRLIAFALVPFALVAGNAAAAKGGPSPGVSVRLGRHRGRRERRSLRRLARREDDDCRRGAHERRARAPVRDDPRRVRDSARRLRRHGRGDLARRQDARARGRRSERRPDALRRPQHGDAAAARRRSRFPGCWAYDALSPNGRTLYATQYLGTGANARYNVRSVSLVTGKPVGGAIVDRREPDEEMNGSPWARARSANGAWAYTLYAKPNGTGVRPRARHRQAARVLRRPAVALELRAPLCGAALARGRRPLARAGEARREPARGRRHHDLQGDGVCEAVARRQRERLRSPSRSPRRPRRCRGWR